VIEFGTALGKADKAKLEKAMQGHAIDKAAPHLSTLAAFYCRYRQCSPESRKGE
jgi:hypothetical protein